MATVVTVRRTLAILAFLVPPLLSLVLVPLVGASPAGAHACALPVQAAVGEPATITVGITAESAAVTGVEVGIPAGFRLTDAAGDGWDAAVQGDVVRFAGNRVEPFACGYVTIDGVAEQRAKLAFPLTLHTADGDTLAYNGTEPYREDGAQLVYAGLDLPTLSGSSGSTAGGLEIGGWLLVGAGGLVALVTAAAWLLSRDAPPEPDTGSGNSWGRNGDP